MAWPVCGLCPQPPAWDPQHTESQSPACQDQLWAPAFLCWTHQAWWTEAVLSVGGLSWEVTAWAIGKPHWPRGPPLCTNTRRHLPPRSPSHPYTHIISQDSAAAVGGGQPQDGSCPRGLEWGGGMRPTGQSLWWGCGLPVWNNPPPYHAAVRELVPGARDSPRERAGTWPGQALGRRVGGGQLGTLGAGAGPLGRGDGRGSG